MDDLSPEEKVFIKKRIQRDMQIEARNRQSKPYIIGFFLIAGLALIGFGVLVPGPIMGIGAHPLAFAATLTGGTFVFMSVLAFFSPK